jgi:hypothetical protein
VIFQIVKEKVLNAPLIEMNAAPVPGLPGRMQGSVALVVVQHSKFPRKELKIVIPQIVHVIFQIVKEKVLNAPLIEMNAAPVPGLPGRMQGSVALVAVVYSKFPRKELKIVIL